MQNARWTVRMVALCAGTAILVAGVAFSSRVHAAGSIALVVAARQDGAKQGAATSPAATCVATLRGHQKLQGVLGLMARLPSAVGSRWNGYRPDAAVYVFLVRGNGTRSCAALWRAGRTAREFEVASEPRYDTPLYGFFAADAPTGRGRQSDALDAQLRGFGVRQAVLVALDGDAGLPFTLGSTNVFDLAVHEAVHLYVQGAGLLGIEGPQRWPSWGSQPNRLQLADRCYGSADPARQNMADERRHLFDAAMASLTGGPIQDVCREARAFLEDRRRRWTARSSVEVVSEAGQQQMSCEQGESIMELNEGVPDFVAWMTAHEIRAVDDARVRQRLGSTTRDAFYLMGMMQLMVLERLLGDRFPEATAQVVKSVSWDSGALTRILESQLSASCAP